MKRNWLALIVVAVVLSGGGILYAVLGQPAPATPPDAAPVRVEDLVGEATLRFHVGDRLTYDAREGASVVRFHVNVLPPRTVTTPGFAAVRGVPFIVSLDGSAPDAPRDVYVSRLAEGGLVLITDACIIDPAFACKSPGDETGVSWQQCSAFSLFAPVDAIPRAAFEHSSVQLDEPYKGGHWTFDVARAKRVGTLTLRDADLQRDQCRLAFSTYVVDLDAGVLTRASTGATTLELIEHRKGDGAEVRIGGFAPAHDVLLKPTSARVRPHPPGLESYGPAGWTYGDAWNAALAQSQDLRAFLAANPDAFVYSAVNTSSHAFVAPDLFGGVGEETREWRVSLLAPSRDMVEVRATQRIVQGRVPTQETTVTPAIVPPDVPARFHAPSRLVADLRAFDAALEAKGFRSPAAYEMPSLTIFFDGEDADFVYSKFFAADTIGAAGASGSIATQYVIFNADTGRLTDGVLSRGQVAALLSPGEPS